MPPSDVRSAPTSAGPTVGSRDLPARVLLVFLDGVGIGPDDASLNPFVRWADVLPALVRLMGGAVPTLARPRSSGSGGCAFPLAATLGMEGTPQSGTGQVALLTGESAAESEIPSSSSP